MCFYDLYILYVYISFSHILFARYHIYSKQIESIISKATNNEIGERKYHTNMKLDRLNEEIIYREYVICLKKHQLAYRVSKLNCFAIIFLCTKCFYLSLPICVYICIINIHFYCYISQLLIISFLGSLKHWNHHIESFHYFC